MKLKHSLSIFGLVAMLGLGVGVGLAHENAPSEARADTYSGTVNVVFKDTTKWSQSSAKIGLYLFNNSVSKNTWTTLQSMGSSKTFAFSYTDLTWQPVNMIVVRFNSSATDGRWNKPEDGDNKYVWNQTGDLGMSGYVFLTDDWTPSATLGAQVRSSAASPAFGTKQYLTSYNNTAKELSGQVTLAEDEEFKLLDDNSGLWSGYYGCPDALADCFSGGSKVGRADENKNIVCEVAGTYNFFFQLADGAYPYRVWITRDDIVAADGFAGYLLSQTADICAEGGESADHHAALEDVWNKKALNPDGESIEEHWDELDHDAKTYFAGVTGDNDPLASQIERAVYKYCLIMRRYGPTGAEAQNLHSFTGGPSLAGIAIHNPSIIESTSMDYTAIIIIVASALTVALVAGGYFFLRKRKEDR